MFEIYWYKIEYFLNMKNKKDKTNEKKYNKNDTTKEMRLKRMNNIEEYDDLKEDNIEKEENRTILLDDEDEDKNKYKEHFDSNSTLCDNTRVNQTEDQLNTDVSKVKNEDLIYFLRCKLNNTNLDDTNKDKTDKYLDNISKSFKFENVFVNNTNYSSMVFAGVCLLIPYFYFYPRVYEMGFWGILLGLFGMMTLSQNVQKYSAFSNLNIPNKGVFANLHLKLLLFSLLFYFVVFVFICKLNHISLFFISYFVVYLIMSYILKLVLITPSDKNPLIKLQGVFKQNTTASKYYNTIETACNELNKRFNMNLPNGQMVYNYLSFVDLKKSQNTIGDFVSYFLQPFLVITILFITGSFFNKYKNEEFNIQTVPIIGLNQETIPFVMCQANYILPESLNYQKKIMQILETYKFDKEFENLMLKFLNKIGEIYIKKYRPLFYYDETSDKLNIQLNENKDFKDFREELEDKRNYLLRENDVIIQQNKPLINEIFEKFCNEYENNLLNSNNKIEEYKNNIILNEAGNNVSWTQSILTNLLGLLSTWLIIAKLLGSSWFLSKYIGSYFGSFSNILEAYKRDWTVWRLASLGVDRLVFENYLSKTNFDFSNSGNTIMKWITQILLFIFVCLPFLTTITQAIFGYTFSPKYINIIWSILVIGNMIGNMTFYRDTYTETDTKLTTWNSGYIIISILILVAVTVTVMVAKK